MHSSLLPLHAPLHCSSSSTFPHTRTTKAANLSFSPWHPANAAFLSKNRLTVEQTSIVHCSEVNSPTYSTSQVDSLKLKLLVPKKLSRYSPSMKPPISQLQSAVSGLNRGLAASEEDLQRADTAAKELEAAAGPVDLAFDIDKLQGKWKLIYSSAFSSRTLGGSRPGPPIGRLLPITLGQAIQTYPPSSSSSYPVRLGFPKNRHCKQRLRQHRGAGAGRSLATPPSSSNGNIGTQIRGHRFVLVVSLEAAVTGDDFRLCENRDKI